jgi:branched-chain amino acid aminotransferase
MKKPAELSVLSPSDISSQGPVKYWIDGKFVDQRDASIPLTDLAIVRGYAAFDALRTYGNTPFLLDAHLKRLEETCAFLHLKPPLDRANMARAVLATVRTNNFAESLIRIYVTGGEASGLIPEHKERLIILVDSLRTYPPQQYEKGIALATTTLNRTLPLAKSTDYVAGIRETVRARHNGFDEVVFLDRQSNILEGTTFSVVVVRGRDLISPADGVLRGITVDHVLGLASQAGLRGRRAAIPPDLLDEADEVFVTSSVREVVPVVRIDTKRIAGGLPGPITCHLHKLYCESARSICSQGL